MGASRPYGPWYPKGAVKRRERIAGAPSRSALDGGWLALGRPAEVGLARGERLVEAAHDRLVRRFEDDRRVLARLASDLLHYGDEGVERLLGLRLGRLDHHRLVNNQR